MMIKRNIKNNAAFSLLELLVALVIISLLTTLSFFGLGSFSQARHLDAALWGVGGMIEQAHVTARARNLQVWVGLADVTKQGVDGTAMVVFTDQSGLNPQSISGSTSGLTPLSSVSFFRDAEIVMGATEPGEVNIGSMAGDWGEYQSQLDGKVVDFPFLFCISPTGEVLTKDGVSPRTLIVSVALSRRPESEPVPVGVVRLGGLSGKLDVGIEVWDTAQTP